MRTIITPRVTTTRTTLDLLGLEMPFTQAPILTPRDFVKEAGNRGVRLDECLLEDLHRTRLLVPFYCVHPGVDDPADVVDVSKSRMADLGNSGVLPRLIAPASRGEVTDPERAEFEEWARATPTSTQPGNDTGIYYSRHQLLVLPLLREYVHQHLTFFVGRPPKDLRLFTRMDPKFMPDPGYEQPCSAWRSVAVILSALDTIVMPELSRRLSWPDQWRDVREAFDANAAIAWLGLSVAELRDLADELLWDANRLDDSGSFYDLIRRADPTIWESLDGNTRVAIDYRIAAEVAARVADLAEGKDVDDDDGEKPLGAQRLSTRRRELDELLASVDLSPHPSVLVIVEGDTEQILFPRVMAELGDRMRSDRIRLENRVGVDKKVDLLAQYAARPRVGRDIGDYVLLEKPPTRVLVLADPEKDYADATKRETQRRIIGEAIVREIPRDLHDDLLDPGSELVTIITWPDKPFEFAHFSDDELADGLISMSTVPHPGGRDAVVAAIGAERAKPPAGKRRKGPDVAAVWDAWVEDYDFSKRKFADEMWPVLQQKVRNALHNGADEPPILAAAMTARRLSRRPRTLVGVERTKPAVPAAGLTPAPSGVASTSAADGANGTAAKPDEDSAASV